MKFGILANITKPDVKKVVPKLMAWLEKESIEFIMDRDLVKYLGLPSSDRACCPANEIGKHCDVVLAFGGDGTFLWTARAVGEYGVPILGVNLGGLGFLAEVAVEHLYESIKDVLNNDYEIVERLVLKGTIHERSADSVFHCLNDIVVDRGDHSRIIRLNIYIDDHFLTSYLCDGVIIATPTGSTAYSLSANGPIMSPGVNAMIINPICPHTLSARPMVISDASEVKIVPDVEGREVALSSDGQVEDRMSENEYLIIRKADYKVQWIKCRGASFYSVLRTKLNWGIDKRVS